MPLARILAFPTRPTLPKPPPEAPRSIWTHPGRTLEWLEATKKLAEMLSGDGPNKDSRRRDI